MSWPGQLAAFVHPGLAWAALAAGVIPILVHLWNRKRYRRVPWAAMQFLLAANRQTARRMWIERMLLLLLRIAVISLFGLAVARPYLHASSMMIGDGARVHRVIVLDDSLSMAAVDEAGDSRFDKARSAALNLLDSFSERDGVSVVTTFWPATVAFDDPMYDRRILRDWIEGHTATMRRDDMAAALEQAREIVRDSESPMANRAVYLISDLPEAAWTASASGVESASMSALERLAEMVGDRGENLVIVPVGATRTQNLAVTDFAVDTPLIGINLPVTLRIGVTNAGDDAARDVRLAVTEDGQDVHAQTLPWVEPGETAWVRMTTVFASAGTHALAARIVGGDDQLSADDARHLSVEVRDATSVLILDGRPGSRLLDGEAGFLATALAPSDGGAATNDRPAHIRDFMRVSPIAPRVIAVLEFDSIALDSFQTIVLCNVPRLTEQQWARIDGFVRRGGGLFITVGDLVDTEHYNKLAYGDGDGVLPCRFSDRLPHMADPSGVRIADDPLTHPIAGGFAGHATSGLFSARTNRYLTIDPDPRRAEIVLAFTDGAPALIVGAHELGRVALMTTSADLDWTNLPAKGDFVSLMYRVISHVTPQPGAARNLTVGATLEESLEAAVALMPIKARSPDGRELAHDLIVTDNAYAVRLGPFEKYGTYSLTIGTQRRDVAVNTDVRESFLRAADRGVFAQALGGRFQWIEEPVSAVSKREAGRASELWFPLFCLVAFMLMVETAVAWRSGSSQNEGAA